ncbi:MAG: PspA/IM30 family protein [Rudaea sp.]
MPNIFDRLTSILRANINDTLDHAEDPEAMLNQIIRDMQDALKTADSDIADQIAQQKMIQADLDEARQNTDAWNQKATLAVSKNMDDLARQALARANDYSDQTTLFQKQLDAQRQAVTELKTKRDALQEKYQAALRNKDMLISRAKRAQAQSRITQVSQKISQVDYSSDLDRMERRIREMEARSDAEAEVAGSQTSVEDQFHKMGEDQRVEDQLAALKAKVGQQQADK